MNRYIPLLFLLLLLVACSASQDSTPSSLDKSDLISVVMYLENAMDQKDASMIGDLIGTEGAVLAPYGVGFEAPGHNNRADIESTLKKALEGANPVCVGYNPDASGSGDRANVFFEGVAIDSDYDSKVTGFLFFKRGTTWDLMVIFPLPDAASYELDATVACPGQ